MDSRLHKQKIIYCKRMICLRAHYKATKPYRKEMLANKQKASR